MAQLAKFLFGVFAVTTSLGVAQLAAGSDLVQAKTGQVAERKAALGEDASSIINRTAKTDRGAVRPGRPGHTIAVRPADQVASSILVRMPASPSGDARRAPSQPRAPGRAQVACEPVVSVLTDIAKLLPPGRCVT